MDPKMVRVAMTTRTASVADLRAEWWGGVGARCRGSLFEEYVPTCDAFFHRLAAA